MRPPLTNRPRPHQTRRPVARTVISCVLVLTLLAVGAFALGTALRPSARTRTVVELATTPAAPAVGIGTTATPHPRVAEGHANRPAERPRRSTPAPLNVGAALMAARGEAAAGHRIGFALVASDGRTLAAFDTSAHNFKRVDYEVDAARRLSAPDRAGRHRPGRPLRADEHD